ncbi:hypothetical protein AN639_11040 [Candidatus Epulonipiscium fishelsonii]|uniref:Uncharacterized protein n=1 Tax=Candidatus Epulonipiscium fishelsonii TaxID=77094 RepID=A0ACC8XD02_9FIRM|nr:hypothetical protein AN396_05865 [Epulopiscium sp. SCG-B11WGA-EpuloA1]ONI43207.1 hypothetical protein AN639_11040 [Epulopiscium sp. SCG-B05WGA-EpuloA1]
MNKKFALVLAGIMSLSVFAGCSSSSDEASTPATPEEKVAQQQEVIDAPPIDVLNQEEKMSMSIVTMQGHAQPDSKTEQWLEERYNLDIDIVVLPGWSDGVAKVGLLMADAEQRPDIVWWWGMDQDFQKWIEAGIVVDVAPYAEKYTVMKDYYNKQNPETWFFASQDDGSMYRIPGDVGEPSSETLMIRKDWLDNLGLPIPTTLDELNDVLYAFTFDDPDGNGVDDTFGLGGDGYDIRSFWPWIQGSGDGYGDGTGEGYFWIDNDGEFIYALTSDDAKIWIERISKLYADGVITTNIITDTDRFEEIAKGGFGVFHGWINHNNPNDTSMRSFYASNLDAQWIPIDMVAGDNGNPQYRPAPAAAWCYFAITDACEDPERAYALWDDVSKPENYVQKRFGIEGEDWIKNEDGTYELIVNENPNRNEEENIGIALFKDLFARKDEYNIENIATTSDLYKKALDGSQDIRVHKVQHKDISKYPVWLDKSVDLTDTALEYMWAFIAGTKSMDEWDQYIEEMNSLGLAEVLEELSTVYPEQQAAYEKYLSTLE